MQPDPQPLVSSDPVTTQPVASDRKLLAPVWHTIVLIVIMLANSYWTASSLPKFASQHTSALAHIVSYLLTVAFEIFLLVVVWFGLRLRQVRMRDLIGGRWSSVEDFLIDVGIAFGFWVVALLTLTGLGFLLGLTKAPQVSEAKKLIDALAPQSWQALAIFVLLSTVAGLIEEVIFRGYLQRQFGALTGNIYIGVVISAIIFGASHGYEGWQRMILIAVFGSMFGLLALWTKSLRPGMMAHAWHDSFSGIGLYLVKRGLVPLK